GFLAYERAEAGTPMPTPEPVHAVWPVLLTTLGAIAVAVLGGLRQTLHASRVAPVEALREHSSDGQLTRMTVGRIIAASAVGLVLIAGYGAIAALTSEPSSETVSNLTLLSMAI